MPHIRVAGVRINVVRKDIKNLHLAVYPPDGRVRIAVPLRISDAALRLAVIQRLAWIKKQQKRFTAQDRQSARQYISRESHYFLGRRYLLNIIEHDGPVRVVLSAKPQMDLYVREGMNRARRGKILQEWYRNQLKELIPPLVAKWEKRLSVQLSSWGVRKMKTRWGTCNTAKGRIWLNLELAKKPVDCLEYIVVHEMLHLLERRHNDAFMTLLDTHYPQWRRVKEELARQPLAHETWRY